MSWFDKASLSLFMVFGAYNLDIIASDGFGLDVDSQKNPENKFTKYAKMMFDFKFSRLIILISKYKILIK